MDLHDGARARTGQLSPKLAEAARCASDGTADHGAVPGNRDEPWDSTVDRSGPAVAVVGLGYVGLPAALALRSSGAGVIGIDISESRLQDVRTGAVDVVPRDLARLADAVDQPDFELTADACALGRADAVVLCVPAPVDEQSFEDTEAFLAACATVVDGAVAGQLIVLTSTSSVGTTRALLAEPLQQRGFRLGSDVFVAAAPERVDPGNAEQAPERTPRVVGGIGPGSTDRAAALVSRISGSVHRVGTAEAAEMSKLWENSFHAVNSALANELADGCCALGLDPLEVVEAAATRPRGFAPFYPGAGAGGHRVPQSLLERLRPDEAAPSLVDAAMRSLAERPSSLVERIVELAAQRGIGMRGARILVLGIAYKPGVADLRGSPALEIIERLLAWGASVDYTDERVPSVEIAGTTLTSVADPAARDWDLVVVHTPRTDVDVVELGRSCPVLDATCRWSHRSRT